MAPMRMISGLGDRLVEKLVPGTEAHAGCTPYLQSCGCLNGIWYAKRCESCGSNYGCSPYCYNYGYCV